MTVNDLNLNESAIIKAFSIEEIPLKLVEMGCVEGSEVIVIKKTLFNDPLFLKINGTHLAIRKELASLIEVERL